MGCYKDISRSVARAGNFLTFKVTLSYTKHIGHLLRPHPAMCVLSLMSKNLRSACLTQLLWPEFDLKTGKAKWCGLLL